MSETFTPGPWQAGRADMATLVDGVGSKWIYDSRDQYVAVASGRIDGDWQEVMANAHLIASAPDLYAVCLMAEAAAAMECGEALAPDFRPSDLLEAARAALAKARGAR